MCQNFVHLLDDSEVDFQEEIQCVQMRKQVFETIRENQVLETDVQDLDVKIALVVKNALSFDELVKASKKLTASRIIKHSSDPADIFAAIHPDKQMLHKRDLYSSLFGLLQTRPEYLARLFWRLSRESWTDQHKKLLEGVVMALFGYTQSDREEFLLLKLFQVSD